MKRTERHHLKENELVSTVARARETYEQYQKPIIGGAVAIVVVIAAVVAFVSWRSQTNAEARGMLSEAMNIERAPVAPPPAPGATAPPRQPGTYPDEKARDEAALKQFMAVADRYPSSQAGIAARYHAAALLVSLGRYQDGMKRYQEVVDRSAGSLYGEMAKLGIADAQAAAGQYDKAIQGYKQMTETKDAKLPVEGILMQLGRAYSAAGRSADARQTFKRIVEEFGQSPYAAEAKREMDAIKG